MKQVVCENALKPKYSYSQAIISNNMVYVCGQVPFNPKTNKVECEGIEGQTRQALDNLKSTLESAGTSLDKVVKVNIFLSNLIDDFQKFTEVYKSYFKEPFPARTTVGCTLNGFLLEIDAIAEL